jgi:hypothetical protein
LIEQLTIDQRDNTSIEADALNHFLACALHSTYFVAAIIKSIIYCIAPHATRTTAAIMPTNNNNNNNNTPVENSNVSNVTIATQERLLIPLTNKKETGELDLHSMTEEDLKLLQKEGKQSRLVVAVPFSSSSAMILSHIPARYTYYPRPPSL